MNSLQEAFVFLVAGVIAVPLASRLGLGSVLGYLIAGAAIGPFALGLVLNAEHIMHIAEFGVVIMLFLIGLELQPALLWRLRKPILGLGSIQVILSSLALGGVALAFGENWRVSLTIGMILALSSTAIALQILGEKKLLNTAMGQDSFSVLLFQDLAVIPIIALLPLLATQPILNNTSVTAFNHLMAWQKTLVVVGIISCIILAGRFLMRPLFRFIAESHLRELFTAVALLIIVGITLMMDSIDLSPAMGAFIAGVVLAENEYRHEIEASIEPFKGLLLGLFFISIGAQIDFALILKQPLLMAGLVFGLVSIKFALLLGLAKLFRLGLGDRYWFAFSLAQGGEFGFVLLALAHSDHVLTKTMTELLTATIALSMVVTPILILLNEKLLQPRLRQQEPNNPYQDEIMPLQHNPVIIAGFGRFGQIVGRLIHASGYPVTVLDNNAQRIEMVRRFGYKIFYGDATREDLLFSAGASQAQLLIIALDDRTQINKLIKVTKRHYPHLKILVRAYDLVHYQELKLLKVDYIERELFQGSINLGRTALEALGVPSHEAHTKANYFVQHDQKTSDDLAAYPFASKNYISIARRAYEDLVQTLQADRSETSEPPKTESFKN